MEDKDHPDRELTGILFPGLVKNDARALQCLGGIRNISQVYSQPNKKRLGLSFQPENLHIKRIFADYSKTAGVVLKVKVKKTKSGNEVKREVVSTSIVGKVKTIYKFDSLSDFQYLPVHREGTGPLKCSLDEIIPTGLDDVSFLMQEKAPMLLTPANFTRSDKPTNYSYTDKRYHNKSKKKIIDEDAEIHNRLRPDRKIPIVRYIFNLIDDLPTAPHEYFLNNKAAKLESLPSLEQDYETVKKLFEERPIWSQNLIRYQTKARISALKLILPCLAIYMKNGPWRMLWVRYGYDPRKEPGARIYQTLDFRLRHQAGIHSMVMTRDQVSHYKKADRVKHNRFNSLLQGQSVEEISEGTVIFRPGMVPSQRQIFYMYCDVKVPEVEAILAAEPPPGYLCHQKRGWLPPNTDQICRDHIFRYVKQTLLATHNADLKLEQGGSSDDGSNSEDDGDGDSSTDEPSTSNT